MEVGWLIETMPHPIRSAPDRAHCRSLQSTAPPSPKLVTCASSTASMLEMLSPPGDDVLGPRSNNTGHQHGDLRIHRLVGRGLYSLALRVVRGHHRFGDVLVSAAIDATVAWEQSLSCVAHLLHTDSALSSAATRRDLEGGAYS